MTRLFVLAFKIVELCETGTLCPIPNPDRASDAPLALNTANDVPSEVPKLCPISFADAKEIQGSMKMVVAPLLKNIGYASTPFDICMLPSSTV